VTDTGSGIPQTLLDQIFEPFFTTKEKGHGTGLGLAVVHRIVLEHGGALILQTREGQGSSFEILLPLVAGGEATVGDAPTGAIAAPNAKRAASILVVDDDEAISAMVQIALQRIGYLVDATNDPRVAMSWLKNGAKKWDVLVTDQTMPHIEGGELVKLFKAYAPATRCIICSGYSSRMNEELALANGADYLVAKPFDVIELAKLVASLVEEQTVPSA